jgi:hypothetical protein
MCMIWLLAISLTVINLGCLLMTTIGLPGTWLMVLTTVVTAMVQLGSDRALFGTGVLIAVVGLAVLGEIAEFAAGLAGSKKAGGTRWGAVGALVGTVIGGIVGTVAIPIPVLGSLLGACLGAALGAVAMELYGHGCGRGAILGDGRQDRHRGGDVADHHGRGVLELSHGAPREN